MSFKVGDQVSVLDEDINGIVSEIKGTSVFIETTDGFILEFSDHELLKTSGESLGSQIFSEQSLSDVISEKEQPSKRKIAKVKPKERNLPTLEVDLHIHQLTNSSRGMSNHDMLNLQLDTARRQLEFAIRKRIQKIVFIHGVGEGVLKIELEYLFGRYENVKYYDADYQKYGVGATEVYVFQNVNS
jgi:dsDNA-specific endonuclease/ATPase MutS2